MPCEVKQKGKRRKCGQPMEVLYSIISIDNVDHTEQTLQFDVCRQCWESLSREELGAALTRGHEASRG